MKKRGGQPGNTNGQKISNPRPIHRFYVEADLKNACIKQAQRDGLNLSEWTRWAMLNGLDDDLVKRFGLE